ncbi:MAG TPA: 4Fe-4S dicluster domain-containing protein [Gemmataceae bacterium]|jgi:NAD-dependent dihydropyrimidine dehydrogenase PreA subunit
MTHDLPALDDTRCTGSGVCVAACPTGCLEMAGGRPWMPRPADCVSCTLCVLVCPTHALTMAPPPAGQ